MARSNDPTVQVLSSLLYRQTVPSWMGTMQPFGHVTEGMDVVDKICKDAIPTDDNGTIESERQPVIESITIKTDREISKNLIKRRQKIQI